VTAGLAESNGSLPLEDDIISVHCSAQFDCACQMRVKVKPLVIQNELCILILSDLVCLLSIAQNLP